MADIRPLQQSPDEYQVIVGDRVTAPLPPPIDMRWCGQQGCGGNLEYRRALEGEWIVTYCYCWKCTAAFEMARFPA